METHGTLRPLEAKNLQFKMIDVNSKNITHRRAIAQGRIFIPAPTLQKIKTGTMPKGNVLAMAEVAGIQAAKKTSELLPLCHPIPLDSVQVYCEIDWKSLSIIVHCEASALAKTGVEMEALCGVYGALLAIYDLTKGAEPALQIADIRLRLKEGGKNGPWCHPLETDASTRLESSQLEQNCLSGIRAAVITVSDRCSQKVTLDRSGVILADELIRSGAEVVDKQIVPDEKQDIQNVIRQFSFEKNVDFIAVTGGTGLGPRDITPDALEELWTKKVAGIGELLRSSGSKYNGMSWLSRVEAGIVGSSLVILFPGSVEAVREGYAAIAKMLPHAIHIIRGGSH